jgi:hypothetical protein
MAKRKGFKERVKESQGNIESLADSFNLIKPSPKEPLKEQGPVSSIQYPINIQSGSDKYPVRVQSGSSQGIDTDVDTGYQGPVSSQGPVSNKCPISSQGSLRLAPKQYTVYNWFMVNGPHGYFNRSRIKRETAIGVPTIKKSINKLIVLNLLSIGGYDPEIREQYFEINSLMKVDKVSSQGPVSSIQSGSDKYPVSSQGIDTDQILLYSKLVSSLKKLTNYVKNSSVLKDKGFSEKQFKTWIENDGADPIDLYLQIQIAEQMPEIQKPKKSAIGYFYTAAVKGTGLKPPVGFQTAEQMKLKRIQKMQAEIEAVEEVERMQAFMANPDILNEIVQGVMAMEKPQALWVQDAAAWMNERKVQGHIRRQAKRLFEEGNKHL